MCNLDSPEYASLATAAIALCLLTVLPRYLQIGKTSGNKVYYENAARYAASTRLRLRLQRTEARGVATNRTSGNGNRRQEDGKKSWMLAQQKCEGKLTGTNGHFLAHCIMSMTGRINVILLAGGPVL